MKKSEFIIKSNTKIAKNTMKMELWGDTSEITAAGQFVNILVDGQFLRRPLSVCDCGGETLTVIYKIVGKGTAKMSKMAENQRLDILTGLGNGYDLEVSGESPLLIGGGVGTPPLYLLAKKLISLGKDVRVILGFNSHDEVFFEREFRELGAVVTVTTADGSYGVQGFVTGAIPDDYSYIYCCGPEPMLKAVYKASKTGAQFSFEERMGCGFGACMGCSCKTVTGYKRICKDGPVLFKEEIIWEI